jgi:pimeloyl-ACP methyl ester carboxylesterase
VTTPPPTRVPRRRPTIVVAAVLASLAIAGSGIAIVGSMGSSGKAAQELDSQARLGVLDAGNQFEAAINWLERRAAEGSDELSRLVRENSPQQLLADAAARMRERLGIFEYQPGDSGEAWTRFDPEDRPTDRPAVILIHGLDEPGDIWDELAPALHQQGHRVLRFNYPNDQDPARSADAFAAALETQIADSGIESVSIIAHSMGGLISRDVLTRHAISEEWGGPGVSRLITVGTPNQGSPVAALQPIGEAREVVARLWTARSLEPSEVLSFLVDGSGDAAVALASGSSYLIELNARPLPETTELTIIAAHATSEQRDRLDRLAASAVSAQLISDDASSRLLDRIDEMTDLVGDGVVPLESTPLAGVDDYHIISANHRSMLRTVPLLSTDAVPPAIPIILEALSQDETPDQPDEPSDSP